MRSAEGVQAVLAKGEEQTVRGVVVTVHPFSHPSNKCEDGGLPELRAEADVDPSSLKLSNRTVPAGKAFDGSMPGHGHSSQGGHSHNSTADTSNSNQSSGGGMSSGTSNGSNSNQSPSISTGNQSPRSFPDPGSEEGGSDDSFAGAWCISVGKTREKGFIRQRAQQAAQMEENGQKRVGAALTEQNMSAHEYNPLLSSLRTITSSQGDIDRMPPQEARRVIALVQWAKGKLDVIEAQCQQQQQQQQQVRRIPLQGQLELHSPPLFSWPTPDYLQLPPVTMQQDLQGPSAYGACPTWPQFLPQAAFVENEYT